MERHDRRKRVGGRCRFVLGLTGDVMTKKTIKAPAKDKRTGAAATRRGKAVAKPKQERTTVTAQQQLFVDHYLATLKPGVAARRAGYGNPNSYGWKLLKLPLVEAEIEAGMKERSRRLHLEQDFVVRGLIEIAGANIEDYLNDDGVLVGNLKDLPSDALGAISEIETRTYTEGRGEDARQVTRVKVKLYDRRQALVDLGRHLGMFTGAAGIDTRDRAGEQAAARTKMQMLLKVDAALSTLH